QERTNGQHRQHLANLIAGDRESMRLDAKLEQGERLGRLWLVNHRKGLDSFVAIQKAGLSTALGNHRRPTVGRGLMSFVKAGGSTMNVTGVGYSNDKGANAGSDAAQKAIKALAGAEPRVVFVFAAPSHDYPRLI